MLYPHQLEILQNLKDGVRYVVASPRCGKTRPVIEFLRETRDVLVLTKKAAIPGWLSELKALSVDNWTVVNYEQVRTKKWDMDREWGALVLDETHAGCGTYPKPNQVTKPIYGLKVVGPRIGVSATPCAESYSQLFHQAKALRLPLWEEYKTFYHWHRVYGIPRSIRAHGRLVPVYSDVKEKAWEEFKKFCVIMDRQKVVPDFVEAEDKLVRLEAPDVLEMCDKIKRDGILRIDDRVVVADTHLAVAQKCAQICAGVVLDDEGEAINVNTVKRDWVDMMFKGSKTAILTTFRAEVGLYGGTDSQEDFRGEFERFTGNVRRFNAGVDLSPADQLVFTGCPWSAVQHQQGRDRLLRRDRVKAAPVYFPVIAGGIDEKIYNRVAIEKLDFTARLYR
jgi:hypothetical protein